MRTVLAALLLVAALPAAAQDRTPSPAGVRAYIITPADGATVKNPVTVRFGLSGMGVAPAGLNAANTGHHHLIIDAPLPPFGEPVPSDEKHLHFGNGETEVKLQLAPGPHILQLLLGDHNHIPHDPPVVSVPIEITVAK